MPSRKQDPPDEGTSKAKAKGTAKRAAKRAASSAESRPPHGGGPPELTRNPDADPVRLHREYVQQRLSGGALPTPEAYAQAVDEWQRLSGSVRAPATDVRARQEPVPDEQLLLGSREREEGAEEAEDVSAATYEGPLPATDPGDNSAYQNRQS